MKRYVVGLGEALWDNLPTGKKLGGAPANFAYHAAQFGMDAIAVSAIGRDALGEELISELKSHKLEHLMEIVDFPTGTVEVTVDAQGIPQYEIRTGVAWDHIPYTEAMAALAANCRAVCFGSLAQRSEVSRNTISRFLDAVPADCLKVFDINLRQSFYTEQIIADSMQRCDILKINDEELEVVAKLFGYSGLTTDAVCHAIMRDYHLQMLILTCGKRGSYIYHDGGMSFMETPDSEVVDTVGAGDSFGGSFVASILCGKSVAEAHRTAVDVSTFVCSCPGAMPLIPDTFKS